MSKQIELFPPEFKVGMKNIVVKDGDYILTDCEVKEIDNPMLYIKYKHGKHTYENWFHYCMVTIVKPQRKII